MTRLRTELRTIARGWRWGRTSPLPQFAEAPKVRRASTFDTEWARKPSANLARGVIQEAVMLPGLRLLAQPTVRGRERLERVPRPAIVVANHVSHLDTALLVEAVPLSWRGKLAVGAAADYFFSDRLRGTAAALAIGAFPVERMTGGAASAKLALRLIRDGWSLILFPEGGRSDDGWLQEITPGAALISSMTGRPIVPVWITGTEHILRRGDNKVRRGRTDVLIGDPILPSPGDDRRSINARLDEAMRRLSVEAQTDWWTSLRTDPPSAGGPEAARWRRVWARGPAPAKPRSSWR